MGWFLLAGGWQLIAVLRTLPGYPEFPHRYILILGLPVILEVISVTVVVRMALMGGFFPDERREWWGRLGALIHRFMLLWILASSCSLLLPDLFRHLPYGDARKLVPLLGGWAAIVGMAVKLAYQPTGGGGKGGGAGAKIKEVFVRIAPYFFMLGILLMGAYLMDALRPWFSAYFPAHSAKWCCALLTVALALLTALLSWRVGVNEFSLHDFYRNRLVRAYLGAVRRRTDRENTANGFTGFDQQDDHPLADLRTEKHYYGPYPLVNTALNASVVSDLDRQDRRAESFVFAPLFCGFDFNPRRSAAYKHRRIFEYGYRPTGEYAGEGGPLAGTAMAISGAAVNPNMGYHSSPATAFLLSVFNVRLGRWIGNPATDAWRSSEPVFGLGYLLQDLVGRSDSSAKYVCLSDGGHFDNMGLYELVRRRCTWILLGDAEEDQAGTCEGLANAIRRCRIDFGADIDLDISELMTLDPVTKMAKAHVAVGSIRYAGKDQLRGVIVYIKTSLTGDESVDIREYFKANPEFPQQSTGDQFFDEAQFESYRNLGYHSL